MKDRPVGADAHICVTNDNNKGSENNNQENQPVVEPANSCVLVSVSCDGFKLPEASFSFVYF